ncbi:MAG: prolyl oligopeptidase family serine peptidase [Phycisphaerales bacterium]
MNSPSSPRRHRPLLAAALLLGGGLGLALSAPSTAAGPFSAIRAAAEAAGPQALSGDDLTLDRLFPTDPIFGPSANGAAFSHDGRWAAWLYRPANERRHGNDLWLLDTESGEVQRVTAVSVLQRFQASTRKVAEDRIAKARKRGAGASTDGADDTDAAPLADDALSGRWTGTMTGDADLVGDDGMDIELNLRLGKDGRVEGTAITALGTVTVTEGRYDADTGRLECVLVEPDSGMRVRVEATIDGESLTGSLSVEGSRIELELSAERTLSGGGADTNDDDDDASGDDEDAEGDVQLEDTVGDEDAKDRRAPRYGGVQSFTWSPVEDEMLFVSGGDLYRLDVSAHADADDDAERSDAIARLTMTQEPESSARYLPDGSGYAYVRGGSIIRVTWGDHIVQQINPNLPGGETLSDYRLSPDGRFASLVTTRGPSWWGSGQQITITDYRSRFANARNVPRHMPGDGFPDFRWRVWIYDSARHMTESGELVQVHEHRFTGPRDVVNIPEWAPDSSRAAFTVFDQATGMVRIMESRVPVADDDSDESGDEADVDAEAAARAAAEGPAPVKAEVARVIYSFAHRHGPNTPSMIRPVYMGDSRRLVFITELSGFRHLHRLDPLYEQLDPITSGRYEVYPLALNKAQDRMWVTSTREHPAELHAYEVDLETGTMERLTTDRGVHGSVAVSENGQHLLATRIDFDSLRELYVIDREASEATALTDSHSDEARTLTAPEPEYFTFLNRHGQEIHGHMFKPDDWSPDDKRPMLLYVYGGPLGMRNMVTRGAFSGPSYFFAYYMARKHGWVTATIDPRGASGFGGLFEKSNFEQVGRPQVEDLVDAANWLVDNGGVDEDRMAMHGWSFGGFQTQMTLYTEPDVFAAGIAGAGPTEWKNYNTWYTTGTIGADWDNEEKKDSPTYSLIPLAKNLKARLLLVHGMEDPNVLYQDTVKVYQALLRAGKEPLVDLFLDPTGGHSLGGDVKSIGRYRKYEAFLLECLGLGTTADDDEPGDDDDEATDDNDRDDDG